MQLTLRYTSDDKAITNTLLGWFWDLLLDYVYPPNLAPNCITLLGLLLTTVTFLITIYYSPTLTSTLPNWVIILNAFAVFMRQTLDATDGKQARRTGASSALGEYLDHGLCDSIEFVYIAYMMCALGKFGVDYHFLAFLVFAMSSHYMEMWAIYMTGELKFWYLSFQESELLAVGCHIIVLVWGDAFVIEYYTITIFGVEFSYMLKEWLLFIGLFQFFSATCIAFYRGASHAVTTNPAHFRLLFPPIFVVTSTSLWLVFSPRLWYTTSGCYVMLMCGFLFAFSGMRMVLARVCDYPASVFYYVNVLPFLGLCNALVGYYANETLLINAFVCILVVVQIHSASAITMSLAEWVNASLLFVPLPKNAHPKKGIFSLFNF